MKQMSLMDSFMKKTKSIDATSNKKQNVKRQQVFTADKLELRQQRQVRKEIEKIDIENDNKRGNCFQDEINREDFAFEQNRKKRRRMDIEDDEQPFKPQPMNIEQKRCEYQQQYSSEDKPKKRIIKPQTTMKQKNNQQQNKVKRMTISTMQTQNSQNLSTQFTDSTPEWATPEGCRDKQGRRPNHPQYDQTTLYVPPEEMKGFTQTMKQYWRIKSDNFDKIILFKLGKFYELFYEDAAVGNKYLELKWMGSKMHVGFPEKTLDKYAHQFVQFGFKLVIVEQLETPDQMKQRLVKQKGQGKKAEKTLQRGVTQVLTKGTMVSFVDENQYLPNYLISVSKHNNMIAYSLLEIGVNIIMIGIAQNITEFKTMLFQTRPVELLYDPDNLPIDIVQLMKQNWLHMILTRLPNKDNVWHPLNAKNIVESMVQAGNFNMPAIFQSLEQNDGEKQRLMLSTLSGMFKYLKNCLKFDYIMSAVKFSFYEKQGSSMCMVMDSQALQHLQIFQTPVGQKDSLFCKLDRTHTKFGKRLLRRWLMQPLLDPYRINQRLDAVQDLQKIGLDRNRAADILSKLPDMQKIVNRLYHYSVKTIAEKAVYFEDISSIRLREFRQLIENFNKCWISLQILRKHKSQFKSQRLIRLISIDKRNKNQTNEQKSEYDDQKIQNGLCPAIRDYLAQFDEFIKWDGDIPKPQKGLVDSYDLLQDQLNSIKSKLDNYLEGVRRKTGIINIKFVHTKQRYQIQIPEQYQHERLEQMIFTSKRSGFSRYVTKESKKLVTDIEYVQQQIKEQMGLFVGYFFEEFRKNQKVWEQFISTIAEIDCLISLSIYSYESGGVRPQFVEKGFDIAEAKHPCLNSGDVIANDINLDSKVMLLTGPNMGGKSTLLRTTCLMVILAQMGCFVPAQRYMCEVIDRIFTRIGASDKLDEGKSTFFIEMQETLSILTYGTHKSLAIIDELGRGTSTYDGMAIAYSVLADLIERVQCRCIFATHYHSLSQQFQNLSTIRLKMMDYLLNDDRIVFLYKLKDGRAEQSFGLNVAKVVRISNDIIVLAARRAKMMEEEIIRKDKIKRLKEAIQFISN